MSIDRKKKLIFLHIPKTAGTTIANSLGINRDHVTLEEAKVKYKDDWGTYFKFTFVRNPWDRIVSVFAYYKYGSEKQNYRSKAELKDVSFEDFVKNICSARPVGRVVESPHFSGSKSMQKNWVISEGKQQLDFVGRFEHLEKDLQSLSKKCRIKLKPIKHERKSQRSSDWRSFYNEVTKNLVGKKFQEDIDFFGYKF